MITVLGTPGIIDGALMVSECGHERRAMAACWWSLSAAMRGMLAASRPLPLRQPGERGRFG